MNNIVQLQKKMPHAYFVLVLWIKTNRNTKKGKKRHHIEPATLSMKLAILTSRFDSPPQSCVVSVTWTCCEHRRISLLLQFNGFSGGF